MTDTNPSARGDSPSPARVAEQLRLLVESGLLLARESSVDVIVQASLDTGLKLSGAAFGAFFYNIFSDHGRHYQLYKVSGVDPAEFSRFPMPRPTAVFGETFVHARILRSGDITQDSRYGHNAPFNGMPPGHLPVRSYLSVPVVSRSGETIGALLYGHPEPDIFTAESESLVATVAAQAAVAMDNARLTENLTSEIAIADAARQLQRETSERLEQAFSSMADSSRRLRQALDAGGLGTWNWDSATDRLDLDERAAHLLFAEPHTPIRRSELRRRIVHSDDLPNTPDDLGAAVLNGGTYSAEYRAEGPDKRQRWIAARGLATFNDAGEFIGMTGTVQDITDRKTQEATLRQSEKLAATGRLAATIAHEINNPLEAVTNLIYLCKTDTTVPPAVHHLLETADDELARVAQIAQQTLGFYRDTTRPGEIDLTAMLHGIVTLFSRKLQFKRLACRTHIQPGLRLYGLQGEIRQVFSNLFVNAIDASENTELTIRANGRVFKGRPGISCLIADRGTGVHPAVRERLFSPFITSKHSVGTGLGLWVTRGIVEKHGGTIAYRTRTQTPTGTVFRVVLPTEVPNREIFDSPARSFLQ
jgi:C4-dicarboxylate-specific signal transduction histidine kinase